MFAKAKIAFVALIYHGLPSKSSRGKLDHAIPNLREV
jgi:hypothetical protein